MGYGLIGFNTPAQVAESYGYNKQRIAAAVQAGVIDPTVGLMAGMLIDKARSAAAEEQAPQTTVAQDIMAPVAPAMPPMPGAIPQQGVSPVASAAPPQAVAAPMSAPAAPTAQPVMRAAAGGLAELSVPDYMFDENAYRGGGIVAFSGGGGPTSSTATVSRGLYDGAYDDIRYLMQKHNVPEHIAIGIIANVHRESSGNPREVGDSGQAYGLFQYHPDRQAKFEPMFGKPIQDSTRTEQLDFMMDEIQNDPYERGYKKTWDMLLETETPAEAAGIFALGYERPDNKEVEATLRSNLARAYQPPVISGDQGSTLPERRGADMSPTPGVTGGPPMVISGDQGSTLPERPGTDMSPTPGVTGGPPISISRLRDQLAPSLTLEQLIPFGQGEASPIDAGHDFRARAQGLVNAPTYFDAYEGERTPEALMDVAAQWKPYASGDPLYDLTGEELSFARQQERRFTEAAQAEALRNLPRQSFSDIFMPDYFRRPSDLAAKQEREEQVRAIEETYSLPSTAPAAPYNMGPTNSEGLPGFPMSLPKEESRATEVPPPASKKGLSNFEQALLLGEVGRKIGEEGFTGLSAGAASAAEAIASSREAEATQAYREEALEAQTPTVLRIADRLKGTAGYEGLSEGDLVAVAAGIANPGTRENAILREYNNLLTRQADFLNKDPELQGLTNSQLLDMARRTVGSVYGSGFETGGGAIPFDRSGNRIQ